MSIAPPFALTVEPLTPARWPDLEALFRAKGCSVARGCWCMYYRESGKTPVAPGQSAAQALAPVLRVCGVSPGVTLLSGPMSQDEFTAAHRLTPLARSSTPEDIARAVRYLLESPAITGTTLLVDGGQHLQAQPRDVLFLARNND